MTVNADRPSLVWNAFGAFLGTATVVLVGGLGIAGMAMPGDGFAPGNPLEFLNGTLKEMGHSWSGVAAASGILVGGFGVYICGNGLLQIYRTPTEEPSDDDADLHLGKLLPLTADFESIKKSGWVNTGNSSDSNKVRAKETAKENRERRFNVEVIDSRGQVWTAREGNNFSFTKEQALHYLSTLTAPPVLVEND